MHVTGNSDIVGKVNFAMENSIQVKIRPAKQAHNDKVNFDMAGSMLGFFFRKLSRFLIVDVARKQIRLCHQAK